MLKRRVIAGVSGLLLVLAGVGTAAAQTSPTVPTTTTTTVLGTSTVPTTTTTTTTAPTTTTEAPTTTVAGIIVTPPKPGEPAPQAVKGDVVSRPLPRTGNDIGGTALFGGALTVLGVALALGARKRRNSFEGA